MGTIPYQSTATTVMASARSSHRPVSVNPVNTDITKAHNIHCTVLLLIINPLSYWRPRVSAQSTGANPGHPAVKVRPASGRQVMADNPRRANLSSFARRYP